MITINEHELLTCKVNIKNHSPTISHEKQALSLRSARFVNNPHTSQPKHAPGIAMSIAISILKFP